MKSLIAKCLFAFGVMSAAFAPCYAGVVSFGSGANSFQMDFVTIGDPGNAADTSGNPNPAGSVGYAYGIGKFEVSRDMITKYNAEFGMANSLFITLDDMTPFGGNGANKPATGVSWYEAARFVNWLNTSTGNQAAYKFGNNANLLWAPGDAGYDASNRYRNSLAKYVLPSYNEWYKAAYYDPTSGNYWDFPTGSNSAPTAVASGTTAGTAVFGQAFEQGPADVNQAGGLSPYGVMGLGGNVYEWEETEFDLTNDFINAADQGYRGGNWDNNSGDMSSSSRFSGFKTNGFVTLGFRVVTLTPSAPVVPEPSMMVIGSILGIGGLIAKRRMRKQPV